MNAEQGPPVAEWLRGKAQSYQRGAATCSRDGRKADAEVYRRVAAELGDIAQDVDAYITAAQS